MDAVGSTKESGLPKPPGPQSARCPQGPQWPGTATRSPSLCPTCGDMPLLWAVRTGGRAGACGERDSSVTCPICHARVRPTRL